MSSGSRPAGPHQCRWVSDGNGHKDHDPVVGGPAVEVSNTCRISRCLSRLSTIQTGALMSLALEPRWWRTQVFTGLPRLPASSRATSGRHVTEVDGDRSELPLPHGHQVPPGRRRAGPQRVCRQHRSPTGRGTSVLSRSPVFSHTTVRAPPGPAVGKEPCGMLSVAAEISGMPRYCSAACRLCSGASLYYAVIGAEQGLVDCGGS